MEAIKTIEQAMREREAVYDQHVPAGQWIILRLDGRSFSSLTEKHFVKPFDPTFHQCMLRTAEDLLMDLQACFAYVGSDEISLLLPPSRPHFDRRIEKLLSIPASIATAAFVQASALPAQFDCRLSAVETLDDVVRYCQWRLADVQRNALSTLTYWTLRHEGMSARQATVQLKEASWPEKEGLLAQRSIYFDRIPAWQRSGVGIIWETYEKAGYDPIRQMEVTALRRRAAVVDVASPGAEYSAWLTTYLGAAAQ